MTALKLVYFILLLEINSLAIFGKNNKHHGSSFKKLLFPNIPEDATLPKLIPKYGYPLEVHKVTTEDGYILTMYRIPRGKEFKKNEKRPAVLLVHGLIVSSLEWVILGPKQGLAYILADAGYDVWMGDVRGTKHSKEHIHLSPKMVKFWDFSLDEISQKDVPAMIDYVIKESGNQKIYYIGYSQGTVIFLMAHSGKPDYNEKIIRAILLAPVAYGQHVRSAAFIVLMALSTKIQRVLTEFGTGEFLPSVDSISLISQILCNEQFPLVADICMDFLFLIAGFDHAQLKKSTLPLIFGHVPSGCSIKQIVQYGQLYRENRFGMFDFGRSGNMKAYNTSHPPDYTLKKITAPVLLIHSKNDWLADPEDVELLYEQLPNADKYLVPYDDFNHYDFLWANDVKRLVYDKVLNAMKTL